MNRTARFLLSTLCYAGIGLWILGYFTDKTSVECRDLIGLLIMASILTVTEACNEVASILRSKK